MAEKIRRIPCGSVDHNEIIDVVKALAQDMGFENGSEKLAIDRFRLSCTDGLCRRLGNYNLQRRYLKMELTNGTLRKNIYIPITEKVREIFVSSIVPDKPFCMPEHGESRYSQAIHPQPF